MTEHYRIVAEPETTNYFVLDTLDFPSIIDRNSLQKDDTDPPKLAPLRTGVDLSKILGDEVQTIGDN